MNGKFSTLMAGLLLASAFSVNAEEVVKVTTLVPGKTYVIAQTGWSTETSKLVLDKNSDGTKVIGIVGNAAKFGDMPKWTIESKTGNIYAKIADGKYLTNSDGSPVLTALAAEPAATQSIAYPEQVDIQVGTTENKDIKFAAGLSNDGTYGVTLVAANEADAAFYTLAYSAGDKKGDLANLELNLTTTGDRMIKIGDKYVALDKGGNDVEMISIDWENPNYVDVLRATWNYNKDTKIFENKAVAGKKLKHSADDKYLTVDGTGSDDFTFAGDDYAARKDAPLTYTNDDKLYVFTGEGFVEYADHLEQPNALIFSATPIVVSDHPDAITSQEFVNEGWYNVALKYTSAGSKTDYLKDDGSGAKVAEAMTSIPDATADQYLWQVKMTKSGGQTIVTLKNKKTGKYAAIGGTTNFVATAPGYTLGMTLNVGAAVVDVDWTAGSGTDAQIGLLVPGEKTYAADVLNKMEDGGFTMSIATAKKDGSTDIEGASVFSGKIKAVPVTGKTTVQLTDADGKYIVLDTKSAWGSSNELNGNNTNNRGYKFAAVAEKDLKSTQYTYFKVQYPGTNEESSNDELIISVYKDADETNLIGYLYVTKVVDKYYLTVSEEIGEKEAWPYVTLGGATLVDLTETFVAAPTYYSIVKVSDEGKALKALGVAFADAEGQWLDLDAVQLDQPEGQWYATSTTDKTKLVLANRENPEVTKTFTSLYKTDKTTDLRAASTIYKSGTDYLVLTPTALADAKTSDGYEIWDQNNLRDEEYTIAISTVLGNGYLAENHAGKHQIGIETDAKNAVAWKLTALTAKASDDAITDSVYVENTIRYWNANKKGGADWDKKVDYLKLVPYTITNAANGEPLYFDESSDVDAFVCSTDANKVDRFVIKKSADGKYNLIRVVKTEISEGKFAWTLEDKVYVGTSANYGNVQLIDIYSKRENDAFLIEKAAAPEYLKLNLGDTIRIFREGAESSLLFEKGEFLGLENIYEYTKMAPAMYVDTAFVNRTGKDNFINNRYQYLLAVEPDRHQTSEECTIPGHPSHSTDITYGRYLVSLEDSAKVEATRNLHTNKYVNSEGLAKFGFVKASHANDTLVIANSIYTGTLKQDKDSINMGTKDFNVAKFAFKVADQDTKAFRIQTGDKKYLKWMNGFIVATEGETNGDIFNLKATDENPTANEAIAAEGVQVVAGKGAVTVQGAAGKVITVANILGQTIANQVAVSDNVTIAAPAGVVVVAVEGDATKVVVK